MPATCSSPSSLIGQYPCLACLSNTELLAVMVLALATSNGYTLPDDTSRLLTDSKCVTCLTDKQLLQALAGLMAGGMLSGQTVTQMRAKIKCLVNANPKQLKAALVNLICQFGLTEEAPE